MTIKETKDDANVGKTEEVKERGDDEEDDAKIEAPGKEEEMKEKDDEAREFPNVFYCAITKELMKDPVVAPDGDSYEKSAIEKSPRFPSEKLYPNRALQAIIEETVDMSGESMRAGLMRVQRSMRKSFSQLLDKSAIPTMEYRPLSDSYYCPITFGLIHDPVIDPEGNTYERAAVANWIGVNGTSPITRNPVSIEVLYPNHAIEELLEEEKCRSEGTMHPSIRKFKLETPPSAPASDTEVGESNPSSPPSGAAANHFPTTQAEMDRAHARRRRAACTLVGITLLLLCVLLFFGVGWMVIVILFLAVCVLKTNARYQRRNQ
jgi:hypothetical protein